MEIGERLKCSDAVYRKKTISVWVVELIGGTNRGGMIRLWRPAESSDIVRAEALPHVFNVTTPNKRWALQDEVHFMYFANATLAYRNVRTVKDALELIRRNI